MQIGASDRAAMNSAQAAAYDAIAQGPRGGVPAPFLAMLDTPALATAIQAVGAAIRFSGTLPDALREVAILATAAGFGSGYEWDYHLPIARAAGVSDAVIEMAATGVATDWVDPVAAAIVALCREAVLARRIDPDTLGRLVQLTDRTSASEIVAISGYYQMLGLFLSAGTLDRPCTTRERVILTR